MTASDAGVYEVKINSIVYEYGQWSPLCDVEVLPLLEHTAAFAPVVFIVQEDTPPA